MIAIMPPWLMLKDEPDPEAPASVSTTPGALLLLEAGGAPYESLEGDVDDVVPGTVVLVANVDGVATASLDVICFCCTLAEVAMAAGAVTYSVTVATCATACAASRDARNGVKRIVRGGPAVSGRIAMRRRTCYSFMRKARRIDDTKHLRNDEEGEFEVAYRSGCARRAAASVQAPT
jgi:hypothetical protein